MFSFLKRKKQKPIEDLDAARERGRLAGIEMIETLDASMTASFEELRASYLGILTKRFDIRLGTLPPGQSLADVGMSEYHSFVAECEPLPALIKERADIEMGGWTKIAEDFGAADLLREHVESRTTALLAALREEAMTVVSLRVAELMTPEERDRLVERGKAAEAAHFREKGQ